MLSTTYKNANLLYKTCLVTVNGSLFVFLQQMERNVDFKMQLSQSEAAGGT